MYELQHMTEEDIDALSLLLEKFKLEAKNYSNETGDFNENFISNISMIESGIKRITNSLEN